MPAKTKAPESVYRTITGARIPLSGLTEPEYRFLQMIAKKYNAKQEWTRFAAWWTAKFNASGLTAHSFVYRICQDLEARLGINQGKVSPPDYRDYLAELIDDQFGSRQDFCRATDVDPGQLSRVLANRDNLSVKVLGQVLKVLHACLVIQTEEDSRAQTNIEQAARTLSMALASRPEATILPGLKPSACSAAPRKTELEESTSLLCAWKSSFPNVDELEEVVARAQTVAHQRMPLMIADAA